jgi:hypothetical protein
MSVEKLYQAVKSGQIKMEDLNDEGVRELQSYVRSIRPETYGDSSQSSRSLKDEKLSMVKQGNRAPASFVPANTTYKQDVPSLQQEKIRSIRSDPQRAPASNVPKQDQKVTTGLRGLFGENPVTNALDYVPAKIAELVTPDVPLLLPRDQRVNGKLFQDGPTQRDLQRQLSPATSTGNKGVDKTLDIAADGASYFFNPAARGQSIANVYGAITPAVDKLFGKAVGKISSPLGQRVAQEAAREGTAAAAYAAPRSLIQGESTLPEIASNVAIEGALGAATGGVVPVAGAGLKGLSKQASDFLNRWKAPKAAQGNQPLLALPAPRELPPPRARGNPNRAVTEDVITTADTRPLGLPEPQILPPTKARIERKPGLNEVMATIRPIVTERMTPPYENPNELAKWIHRSIGVDNLSLNEVRTLSYEDMRQVAEELSKQMNVYEMAVSTARELGHDLPRLLNGARMVAPDALERGRETLRMREAAGLPPLVRSQSDRYAQGVMGEALPPVKRLARAPQLGKQLTSKKPEMRSPKVETAPASEPKTYYYQPDPEVPPIKLNQEEIPFSLDESLDDIKVPELEEVAPRVRDRVTSYADQLINSAKAELAASRNRLSSTPIDIYAQYAKIGAGYMLKGTVKLADFTEQLIRDFGEEIRPHVREIFKRAKDEYRTVQKNIESEELGLIGFEAQKLKDLSNLNLNTADVYRNFRKVFGKHFEPIKKAILDPFDAAKGAYAQEQKVLTDKLYNEVVKGLGIRKGSKESALVQRFGEGQINLVQLQGMAPDSWKRIVKADAWFRNEYDRLIRRVNESVARIYPNRPEKLVPFRKDYYRHFQELKGWGGLVNMFDTASAKISPSLSGMSPYTTPKTKWASFKQQRGLGEFTNDAVGGFLEYIPAASYAIHIDPQISVFRNLAKRLSEDTETTANINNFIKFINNFANDLSGKTSSLDRWVEEIGGRNGLRILTNVNNRVKSNVILGNVRSTLSQLANIPNGIAYGGIDAPAGAIRTLQSIWQPNGTMSKSAFLKERYLDKSFRRFDQRWWEQPRRFAEAMMEISDRVGTSFVWNTAYAKGVRQKVANPVKFADEQTRRLVGGRGVGEQPLLIKSKMFNLVAPFQLEVNNLWRVMKDFVDERRFGALVTLLASNWLLNKAFEKVTGSGVVFDPIDALTDAATEEDVSILQRGGRVAGEVLSNVPFGQTMASLYPEYGTNLYGVDLPSRKELFGEKDPTRFGSGLLAAGAVTDPLFKFVLPFGGNQLKKATQGADALLRGGSYTENVLTTGLTIEEPKLKFPVDANPADAARGVLFGPYATSQGQEYTRNERRPLSESQTKKYLTSRDQQGYYDRLMDKRRAETEKRKLQAQK